jgi:V/A-type H+-transporting ATPase subunit I
MIIQMKLVTLLCLEQDRSAAVDALAGLELMQLCRTAPPATKDVASISAQVAECERVAGVIRSAPTKKDLDAAPEIADDELVAYASKLISGKTAAFKELERLQRDLDLLAPWGEFDRSAIAKLQAKGVYVTLCATPRNVFDQRTKDDAFPAEAAVSVIRMDKNMVHYALVSEAPLAEGAFDPVALPEQTLSETRKALEDCRTSIAAADASIAAAKELLPRLETRLAALRNQLEFASARDGMERSGEIAYLQGYVPVTRLEKLKDAAMKNGWALQIDDPAEDDQNVPTYIEKARFLNVLDPLFDFVGISPGYRESDVNVFFFFFFPIFFGMILGDAGYGALMLVAGTVGLIALHAKKAARLPLVLLIFLATFTFIWGWLNGAWFGLPADVLPGWMRGWSMITDPAHSAAAHKFVKFYGIDDEQLTQSFWDGFPSKLTQWFCFLLAMLHLMSAHIVRFFTGIRKDWRELSNIGWALMIFANFLLAVGLIVFSGTFPSWGVYVYVAGAALILVTIRPAQALNLPFDMIGSFTDVLSYIRLFAVGLSGMYIAQKFNMMGMMVKDALADKCMILGFVLLILVAVAGHILNLALGFLGVLVHAVRLNTLEFSNHMGLQWAGFKFKPFSARQNNN